MNAEKNVYVKMSIEESVNEIVAKLNEVVEKIYNTF